MGKTYKGYYRPKNPDKYNGDPDMIIYRSLWERKVMKFFDFSEDVLEWSSEEIIIPYISPVDNKAHRYFVDFYAHIKPKRGEEYETLIEVKPFSKTLEPKRTKGKSKRVLQEQYTEYAKNTAKWEAAEKFCAERGWKFMIWTERELGL